MMSSDKSQKVSVSVICAGQNVLPNVENVPHMQHSTRRNSQNISQFPKVVVHDYEDVLDMIGFGCTQWIVLITCGLLLMMVINETMGMSIITIASQCDFATTSVHKAIMSAASFVGIAIFSYVWGYLSDTVGRRVVLIYATFGACFFSAISMFIRNYWAYVFMRFVVGIFIAGPSSTTYAFLAEFFTTRHRPIVVNYSSLFVGVSMTYVPAVAWLVLSMDWTLQITSSFNFRPWHLLTFFNLLPGLIAVVVLLFLPESPQLYLSLRKEKEALKAVNWICELNTGNNLTQFGVKNLKAEVSVDANCVVLTSQSCGEAIKHVWKETRPLLRRPYALNFFICCFIMCGMFFSSSGMGLWFSEIQNRASSNSNSNAVTVCEIIDNSILAKEESANFTKICNDSISDKSFFDSISLGLCFVVGYALTGVILNIFGRKSTIIGSLLLSALCCAALLWLRHPTAVVVCFIIFLTMPGLCVATLSSALVDLVPTHLRGKAICLCLMMGRSGSVFGSNIIGVLLETHCISTFAFFSGCVFVCMLLTILLPI
ncbi:synaptic vesicle glycoprotein 2B-like [Eurosta solidaginis]|uniref:synaptic vesicle glycoprotein 2B-like n=1 Tax=Eurosta solidaginis TaxID=178769 RepID=UPI00353178B2